MVKSESPANTACRGLEPGHRRVGYMELREEYMGDTSLICLPVVDAVVEFEANSATRQLDSKIGDDSAKALPGCVGEWSLHAKSC